MIFNGTNHKVYTNNFERNLECTQLAILQICNDTVDQKVQRVILFIHFTKNLQMCAIDKKTQHTQNEKHRI